MNEGDRFNNRMSHKMLFDGNTYKKQLQQAKIEPECAELTDQTEKHSNPKMHTSHTHLPIKPTSATATCTCTLYNIYMNSIKIDAIKNNK